MNLLEHAKADYKKIMEADPSFIQRQLMEQAKAQDTLQNSIKI